MTLVRPQIALMRGYVPGEQPQGGKWIKLNTNENPYNSSPKVQRAIGFAIQQGLQKYPDPQATAFRSRAAQILGVPADWILCGNGSDDILTIVTRAFVGEGDILRFPYPSYILYATLAELQGATAHAVPYQADWSLGEDFCAADPRLKLACIANPNSPSGTLIPPAGVLALAEKLSCPLLVDEAYGDFADANCLELVKRNERIMVSRTLSKSYALAGIRFGFLVAQPQVIAELNKVKDSYNCDALSIAGATAAIDDQAWLAENRAKILATRQRLSESLRKLGFEVLDSQANFVWCNHPGHPPRELYEKLKAQQVLVRYMNYPNWGDGLRITVGTDEQIEGLLMLLAPLVWR
ncbi:MAG: histidinol-phosphate transaminase [Pirellulales bacterium]|nr:histidinol-phosphate transaminase [Pirellulales bacterium]